MKFSELRIVGYVRHRKSVLSSWIGETMEIEVVGPVPDDAKIWKPKDRVPYDDLVELRPWPKGKAIGDSFVVIAFPPEG
jgi:hypothetical protein